ncbi:MAG: hypothetical protein JW716_03645 [Candidatus Aenigmarchaeota archaeon]|nr:hypothetical protein [Candidatus Aenigmarchaeota archaeon]
MEYSLYYDNRASSVYHDPYALAPHSYIFQWNNPYTENNGYIIHQVNMTAYYRSAKFYNNNCIPNSETNKGMELYVRNTSTATNWLNIKESSSNTYNYFSDDVRNSIDRNNYSVMLKAQENDKYYCVELRNASLLINYTEVGWVEITTDTELPDNIPLQSSDTITFKSTCKDGYCGKMTYELYSTEDNIRATNTFISTNYLGTDTGETESEEFQIEITGVNPGEDYISVRATGFYNNQDLGIRGESIEIPVTVSTESGSSETLGRLQIANANCPDPTVPIYRGEDIIVGATVKCIEGDCGDVTGTISTGLGVSGSRNINHILDRDKSYNFNWTVSTDNAVIGDDGYVYMGFSAPGIDSVQEICKLYFRYDTLPTTTGLSIEIDYPKVASLTALKTDEQFELSGRCIGDCTGIIKCYALYKNSFTPAFSEIGPDTQIYLADSIHPNPMDCGTLAKWNLKARDSGTYELGIKAVKAGSPSVTQNTGLIEVHGDDDSAADNIMLDIVSPMVSEAFKRGHEFDIEVKAYKDGSYCTDCILTASSQFMESDVTLGYSNGLHTGKGRISEIAAAGLGKIKITVNQKFEEEKDLTVEPIIQLLTGSTDRQIYNTFDEIKIIGVTEKRAYVSAELVCGDTYKKKSDSFQANGLGAYSIDNIVISRAVPAGSCQIKIEVVDAYNNRGEKTLDVIINPSDMNNYNLAILSPSTSAGKITKGEKVPIIVRVTQNNRDIKNMIVNCTDINGDYTLLLAQEIDEKENVFYRREYNVPLHHNKTEWVLVCIGENNDEYGTNSVILQLEGAGLTIKVLEPSHYEQLLPGQTVKVKVKAEYGNGVPANDASIRMRINGEDYVILERGVEPGTYVGTFDTGEREMLSFDFSASDDKGITGGLESFMMTVKKPDIGDYLFYIIGAVILIVIVFSAVVVYARKGKTTVITKTEKIDMEEVEKKVQQKHMTDRRLVIKEKLRDLQLEFENIENDIDMLHSEYFRREIDEETFVKLLQERKERKENIASTMSGLAKELGEIEVNDKSAKKQKWGDNVNYGENEGTA